MKIVELSKSAGCDVETIRYYERAGLLDEPDRTSAGYRDYQLVHQERLQFIRHCRALQMSLADIRVLLELRQAPQDCCQGVNELLDHHISRIQEQMTLLRELNKQLVVLRKTCSSARTIKDCAIIQNLSETVSAGVNPSLGGGE